MNNPTPPAAASDAAIAQAFRERFTETDMSVETGMELQRIQDRAAEIQSAQPSGVAGEWRWIDEQGRAMTNWKQGDPPPMREVSDGKGTMCVETRDAPPIAQQGGVEELWKFVERAYDAAKTSRSERLLDDLGLPVSDVEMPLSWHINRAALAGKADGGES